MTEVDKLNQTRPIHTKLIEFVENNNTPSKYPLNMLELRQLFEKQAEADDSGDEPKLFPNSVFEITSEGLHIFTPYTVSNADKPLNRKGLVIEGTIKNNNEGYLSDETKVEIYPEDIRVGVYEAFEVGESLSMKTYIKSMIEDALRGKVSITNMSLKKDNLVLELEKSN